MTPSQFDQWLVNRNHRTLVMGVLNVTPDSFSDGGRFADPGAAIARGEQIASEGADLIDIGGESTRPGSDRTSEQEQLERIIPVIRGIAGSLPGLAISVDTMRRRVAEAALDAGASIINDISAGRDDHPEMFDLAARRGVPIILMHIQGNIKTMQMSPTYQDVVKEVGEFLQRRARAAEEAGIDPSRILLDPGIGFGKNMDHNLALLRRQRELASLGRPLVIGTSRKKFIGTITRVSEPDRRVFGTAATTAWAVANGAGIVRVHDVEANVQVVRMIEAILGNSPEI